MADYFKREDVLHALFNGEHNLYSWFEIEEKLDAIPSADVQPVVHGEWEAGDMPTYCGYKCSICGKNTVHYKACFCPNCGADMRKDGGT